ncbi:tRNA wybutosine-synthesizing protein 3 homolog [Littorina saxatilis]|uniref:tRNA wybutosine-synthesizing protein 3 homolog n=1 Tax=Littorina saxatilis TaxID=31220 RepID=A0AAN9BUT3_9CAEN
MEVHSTHSKQFLRQKEQCLSGVDLSRKGSVDAPILELVNFINSQCDCFTTSSCSGRIIVVDNTDDKGEVQKQGCQWLYVTHEEPCFSTIQASLRSMTGSAVFKFEPMVMHIQVRTLQLAQRLHAAAVASGFRNSGITIGGKGKIIVAVRSTHSLEAPLSCGGELLVTDAYIRHLALCANKKMLENLARIARFFDNFKTLVENPLERDSKKKTNKKDRKQDPALTKLPSESVKTASVDRNMDSGFSSDHSSGKDSGGMEECFDSLLFEET